MTTITMRWVQPRTGWISSLMLLCAVNLSGCSSMTKKPKLGSGDMTMTQIYDQTTGFNSAPTTTVAPGSHMNVNDPNSAVLPVPQFDDASTMAELRVQVQPTTARPVYYTGYTRNAQNEVDNLFKPLANPAVPVYVYPHLSQVGEDAVPVPGYTTSFFLYQQPYFAMPSESY